MSTQPLVIERTFNAPIGVVWQAITDNDKMKEWYFDYMSLNQKLVLNLPLVAVATKKHTFIYAV